MRLLTKECTLFAVCLAAVVDCSLESLFVCFVSSLDSAPLHNLSSVCGVDFSIEGWHQLGPPWYYLLQYLLAVRIDREIPHVLP